MADERQQTNSEGPQAGGQQRPTDPERPTSGPGPVPVDPREVEEPDPDEAARLREVTPDLVWERVHQYVEVTVPADRLLPTARVARDELGYDYLSAVTAVDYRDHLLMAYHLYSFDYRARPGGLVLQVRLPLEPFPALDSLTSLWPGAEFQEREVWDLMGVRFLGHPDLRRILLTDDFPGNPLRKDFSFDYEYVLVRHLRHGAEGLSASAYLPPHEQIVGPESGIDNPGPDEEVR